MKRIIDLRFDRKDYVDCVVRFDSGETTNTTMTRNEYDTQILKQNIFDGLTILKLSDRELKEVIKAIEDIEQLAYERGHDSGYEDGYNQAAPIGEGID